MVVALKILVTSPKSRSLCLASALTSDLDLGFSINPGLDAERKNRRGNDVAGRKADYPGWVWGPLLLQGGSMTF